MGKEGKTGLRNTVREARGRDRETGGIYDPGPTYVSAHYGPRGIKGAAFTTSHIQPFTASEI